MTIRWSEEDLKRYKNYYSKTNQNKPNINKNKNNQIDFYKNQKKTKYGNIRIKIDGHTFDSKKEANYYLKLKNDLSSGLIKCVGVQPKFLLPGGIIYKADFIVIDCAGKGKIIDIKGFETKEFKLKQKLFNDYFDLDLEVIK